MIPNPLVHIGYHKTATTWLQRTLFSTDSEYFVPLSPDGNPNRLGRCFVFDRDGVLLSPFEMNRDAILDQVAAVAAGVEIAGKIPVISHERLSGNFYGGAFDAKIIADRIKACLPNARILCVIREQKDMILSTYHQFIRIGGTDSLGKYLARRQDGKRPGFTLDTLRYVDAVSYYQELFGRVNTLVLPYELLKTDPDDFAKRIGNLVSVSVEKGAVDSTVIYNERTRDSLALRFPFVNLFSHRSSVNSHSPLYSSAGARLVSAIDRLLGAIGASPVEKFEREIEAAVQDRYEAGNRELSERIGIDLAQFGYHRR
jgi:hypothetical protein